MTSAFTYKQYAGPENKSWPLVLCHGFMGSKDDWEVIAESLARDYHSVAVDMPGHGSNVPYDLDDYTMTGATRQLIMVMNELGVDKVLPVGYSMGGRFALHFAANNPRLCRALILESASPGLRTSAERRKRAVQDDDLATMLDREGLEAFLTFWYEQPLFDSLRDNAEAFQRVIQRRLRNHSEGLARSLRNMGTGSQGSVWDRLPKVDIPVLLIVGERDDKFCNIASEMADLCPHAEVRIIAGAGHNVHQEQPEVFVREIRSFLSKLS